MCMLSPMPTLSPMLSLGPGSCCGQKGRMLGGLPACSECRLGLFQFSGCEENDVYLVLTLVSGIWNWITYFMGYLRHRKDLVAKTPECHLEHKGRPVRVGYGHLLVCNFWYCLWLSYFMLAKARIWDCSVVYMLGFVGFFLAQSEICSQVEF